MESSARARLVVSIALIVLGLAATWAAADGLINNTPAPPTDRSQAGAADEIEGATGAQVTPRHDELGAFAESSDDDAGRREDRGEAASCGMREERCERRGEEKVLAATWAGETRHDSDHSDSSDSVDRVVSLIPEIRERPLDLPTVRECVSSIGGQALCFDFGDGNYLVGDAPDDGEAELGFCTDSGYYFVSGPSPAGGAGGACPDESGSGKARGGDEPTARECTSGIGGEATCFDFGDGNYLVSDPLDDGEGELGFCTDSGYYFVSAPSAHGDAGAKCPHAATR